MLVFLSAMALAQPLEIAEYGNACSVASWVSRETTWTVHCEERFRDIATMAELREELALAVPFSFDPSRGLVAVMDDFLRLHNSTTTAGAYRFVALSPTEGILQQETDGAGNPTPLLLDTVIDITAQGRNVGRPVACAYLSRRVMGAIHDTVDMPDVHITVVGPVHPSGRAEPDFRFAECTWPIGPSSARDVLLSISATVNVLEDKHWIYHAHPFLEKQYALAFAAVPRVSLGDTSLPSDSTCTSRPCKNGKVNVCHKPAQNAENTLCISESAVPAHMAHGDVCGPCG